MVEGGSSLIEADDEGEEMQEGKGWRKVGVKEK